jgi:hypothetical protein
MAITYWWDWYKAVVDCGFNIKSVESRFNCKMYGTTFIGYIDLILEKSKRYLVVDWKTGFYDIKNNDMEEFPKKSMQLFLYGKMAKDRFDVEDDKIEVGLYYPMADQFVAIKLVESQAEEIVLKCLEGVAENNFTKNLGEDCGMCSYKEFCLEG